MKALIKEKALAIKLRCEGKTLNEICAVVKKGKGTVFYWIRDIKIDIDRSIINRKNLSKGSLKMQEKYKKIRDDAYDDFYKKAPDLLKDKFFRDFVVSYFCEGGKTQRNRLDFTNTEPRIIKLFLFFSKMLTKKPPIYVLICHKCTDEMRLFWSKQLNIDKNQIKNYDKGGNCSKKRSNFGTLKIQILDTAAMSRMSALIDYILKEWDENTAL